MKRIYILIFCFTPLISGTFLLPIQKSVSITSEKLSLSPTPTAVIEETLEASSEDFKNECDPDSIQLTSFSPHQHWEALQCEHNDQQVLDLANKDGRNTVLLFTDYLDEEDLEYGMIPMGYLSPEYWTADGKSLYFFSYVANDGGGVCFYGFGYSGLWKIELETGKISTVLPVRPSLEGYYFSFSPDGRYLAYIHNQPTVRDLDTGIEYELPVKGDTSANLAWSTGGENLYFVSCTIDAALQQEKETVLYKYSLSSKKLSTVFKNNGYLSIESFDGDRQLIARSEGSEGTIKIEIDPQTRKPQIISPVP